MISDVFFLVFVFFVTSRGIKCVENYDDITLISSRFIIAGFDNELLFNYFEVNATQFEMLPQKIDCCVDYIVWKISLLYRLYCIGIFIK